MMAPANYLLAEPNLPLSSREDYVADLVDRLQAAHDFVWTRQAEIRAEDNEAPRCSHQVIECGLKLKGILKGPPQNCNLSGRYPTR